VATPTVSGSSDQIVPNYEEMIQLLANFEEQPSVGHVDRKRKLEDDNFILSLVEPLEPSTPVVSDTTSALKSLEKTVKSEMREMQSQLLGTSEVITSLTEALKTQNHRMKAMRDHNKKLCKRIRNLEKNVCK
jgi:hypothetical protein